MSSASRSRLIAVAALAFAALTLLLLACVSTAPRAMLAPAPETSSPALAAAQHLPLHSAAAISSRPLAQLTAHTFARARAEEIGGSDSTTPDDVPAQAYVNKVEHLRSLRIAKLRAR